MKSRSCLAVLLGSLAWAPLAAGAETHFKKAYFGQTTPGSFARLRMTDEKGAVSEYTYSRLADLGDDRWIELHYAVVSGQFKGTDSVTACLVPASFALDQDAIDFQAHARRCAANSGGGKATEYPADTMKAIASGVINYASLVVFKGPDKIDGRACDHYTYAYKTTIMNKPGTMNGDLWLSDAVPFGLVKESATTVDAAGKVLSRYETILVETGTSARSALPGWSWGKGAGAQTAARPSPAAGGSVTARSSLAGGSARSTSAPAGPAGPMTLPQAFAANALKIVCEVVRGSQDGSRVRLTLSNASEKPLKVTLTRAPMTLEVGAPLETLTLAADFDRTVEIAPTRTALPLEVNQRGKRRAISGKFTVSRYEGKPLFSGSVDVGFVKE
jgi:hypothetical protein